MEFSRQEYWSGMPFPSAGDLPDPGMKPRSPALQADSLPSELQGSPLTPRDELLFKKKIILAISKFTAIINYYDCYY